MMRGMAVYYLAGMPFSSRYKVKVCNVHSLSELAEILTDYKKELAALR